MENNPKIRDLYDTFLDSGELLVIMPEATCIWDKDKTLFSSIYSNLDDTLLHINDLYEEDEEDFFFDEDYF
jgi:hypothetical protein